MAKKLVITSGKGGVGKTTITANVGLSLAKSGYRVMLIDGDMGLNNLDVITDVDDKIVYDLIDVLNGKCRAKQALIQSAICKNLFVMPCAHSLSQTEITSSRLKTEMDNLDSLFDYIFIDCPAGIEVGFHRAVSLADEGIVVVTPNIASIRDADKVISILKSYKLSSIKIIVNRMRGDLVLQREMYSHEDIISILKVDLLGVIPEDDEFIKGLVDIPSEAEKAIRLIGRGIIGKSVKPYDYLRKYTGFFGSIRREIKKRVW